MLSFRRSARFSKRRRLICRSAALRRHGAANTRYIDHQAKVALRNDKGDLQPQVIFMSEPSYAQALNLSGLEGSATVECVVDKDGLVRSPKVMEATHPAFGDSAIEAVSQWRFLPGQKAGVAVDARMMVPIYFQQSKVPRARASAKKN